MSCFLGFCEGDRWREKQRWRDGQVCPDVDKELWCLGPDGSVCFGVLCANRTREVKRDFGDLPIRRSEGRVVNTPLVFKRVLFQKKRTGGKEKEQRKRTRESGRENGGRRRRDGKEREETERD
ncbi:hypothetical protein TNCV_1262931 [Trichonephila clavipes]|nr:hypothetical protein TNCV_1262931 [Trichonephila clavipes]